MIIGIKEKIKILYRMTCQDCYTSTSLLVNMVKDISKDPIGGLDMLLYFLLIRKMQEGWIANYIDGLIYEILVKQFSPRIRNILTQTFGHGVVVLKSQKNIDYLPLQNLLISKQYQEANTVTHNKLRELSNLCDNRRSWLYFTDVSELPIVDLITIDNLWRTHSLNKFGFSIQRQIWLVNNKDWNKLWDIIGWRINQVFCKYPDEFCWDTDGPVGHLPLFNQLYGIQPLLALFQHKAWEFNV